MLAEVWNPKLGLDADHRGHHLLNQVAEAFGRRPHRGRLGDGLGRMVESRGMVASEVAPRLPAIARAETVRRREVGRNSGSF